MSNAEGCEALRVRHDGPYILGEITVDWEERMSVNSYTFLSALH